MPELNFDKENHLYTVAGVRVPSVTGILTEVLGTDTQFFRKEHRERGSRVHSLCSQIAKLEHPESEYEWSGEVDYPEILPYGKAFQRWVRETGFEVKHAELPVYSESLGVAGTFDMSGYCRSLGKVVMIDIKSGTPPEYTAVQLSAYTRLLRDHHHEHIEKRFSLQLSADTERGEYRMRDCSDASGEAVFVSAINIYRFKQRVGLIRDRSGSGPGRNANGNGNRY